MDGTPSLAQEGEEVNVDILEEIASDDSRLFKEAVLPKLDEDLRRLVKLALDPDVTFGVTVDEDEALVAWTAWKGPRYLEHPSDVIRNDINDYAAYVTRLLGQLSSRTLTGNIAKNQVDILLCSAPTLLHVKWTARIINRNLRAGFDIRTFNAVFDADQVHTFAVQLAQAYEGQNLIALWFFQPKLDGNRVIFIDGKAMSRSGKVYPNCDHVMKEILVQDPTFFERWVIDGEMMGDLGFDESSGALRRQTQEGRKKATFTYYAFDLIDRKEWQNRKTRTLFYRDMDLRNILGTMQLKTLKLVPTEKIHSPTPQQIMEICATHVKAGFEGAMAKQADSQYMFKRADNILKVKLFSEDEFTVTGFYSGRGRNKDTLGGMFIAGEIDWSPPMTGFPKKHYSVKSKCGGGFSDPMRDLIWNNQADWLGAVVQVQFFEATKDGSLRFPVFVMRRKDKEGGIRVVEREIIAGAPRRSARMSIRESGSMSDQDLNSFLDELEKEYK
jgi:hypothetical protein